MTPRRDSIKHAKFQITSADPAATSDWEVVAPAIEARILQPSASGSSAWHGQSGPRNNLSHPAKLKVREEFPDRASQKKTPSTGVMF